MENRTLRFCTACREQVSPEAAFCTSCGKRAEPSVYKRGGRFPVWMLLAALFCGGVILTALTVALHPDMATEERASAIRDWAASNDEQLHLAANLCAQHSEWAVKDCRNVAQKRVAIGMTSEQVMAAWGYPSAVNKTTVAGGVNEQWVYRHHGDATVDYAETDDYVYLENGVVTAIQNDQ